MKTGTVRKSRLILKCKFLVVFWRGGFVVGGTSGSACNDRPGKELKQRKRVISYRSSTNKVGLSIFFLSC